MISCCWNAHVMWNRNWAKSMQHIVLFVFPFYCADFSRNKYIYGRLIKLKNTFYFYVRRVLVDYFFCSAGEKNHNVHTQNFCHTISNSKNNRTFAFKKCIYLSVIGKSVFCLGGGGRLERHMVPGTAIYGSILYNWKCFYVCRRAGFANTIPQQPWKIQT